MTWSILLFISIIWRLQVHSCTFLCGPKQDKCVDTLVPLNLQLILITKTQNRMQRRASHAGFYVHFLQGAQKGLLLHYHPETVPLQTLQNSRPLQVSPRRFVFHHLAKCLSLIHRSRLVPAKQNTRDHARLTTANNKTRVFVILH